jgi:undecaprenyl-diphosphatase
MFIRYIILGAVQGLTEFLPVSSSGHLVILQRLFQVAVGDVGFVIIVHLASLAAVLFFLRHELASLVRFIFLPAPNRAKSGEAKLLVFIFSATLITTLLGFAFKNWLEGLFSSTRAVIIGLAFSGGLLFLTKFKIKTATRQQEKLNIWDAILVGLMQAIAIIPGVSRSGSTISSAILKNIDRQLAVKLSFLLSIPAILGVAVFKIKELNAAHINPANLAASFISAFVFSFLALQFLVSVTQRAKLHYFAYYCWLLSALVFYLYS